MFSVISPVRRTYTVSLVKITKSCTYLLTYLLQIVFEFFAALIKVINEGNVTS